MELLRKLETVTLFYTGLNSAALCSLRFDFFTWSWLLAYRN